MITKIDHMALSVTNMKESLAFYCDILGMKIRLELEPGYGGDKLGKVVGMPDCRAHIVHLDLNGTMLELFQYLDPEGRPRREDAKQADIGLNHFCVSSTDVRADYVRLKELGVKFIGEPVEFRPGVWIVYMYGPDKEVCELRPSNQ